MIWRYSRLDSIPFTVTLLQLTLNIWLAATWESRTLTHNVLFLPLCLFLFWYNGLVASHNFVHTPWFKSDLLNQLYLILNSINLGLPQAHYRQEHLLHHRYGNDRRNSQGKTQDPTSLFAYGRNGQQEPLISYSFLGLFRTNLIESFRTIVKRGEGVQLGLELLGCGVALVVYCSLSWQYVCLLYLPTFYLGWVSEHVENYYEHFGSVPENRYANSTSYYGRVYNLLFCNEGYHQEHHLRPNVHWLQRPETRQALRYELERVNRVILRFPPVLGLLDHQRIWQERYSATPEMIYQEVVHPEVIHQEVIRQEAV